MNLNTSNLKIDKCLEDGEWSKARKLLEVERKKSPQDHWILTQLGVTYYEEGKYKVALKLFEESRSIVDDCPLTLWNAAGAYDALGKPDEAIAIYASLIRSPVSANADPCWESQKWAIELKADCFYRLGACFEHKHNKKRAMQCYDRYLALLAIGIHGTYDKADVVSRLETLQQPKKVKSPSKVGGLTKLLEPTQNQFKNAVLARFVTSLGQLQATQGAKTKGAIPEVKN